MSTYDYIIIGAGSAGCVLANRLSANPANRVLLIEAGKKDTKMEIHIPAAYTMLNHTSVDWAFETVPQANVNNRKMYQPRGKTLGGCSATNAMAYIRGNAKDYDDWASLGNQGWAYEEVLPYFLKSERNEDIDKLNPKYHSADGLLWVSYAKRHRSIVAPAFVEACKNLGIPENHDFNGEQQEGAGFFQFTIKDGVRQSTATAFLKPIKHRKNLTILTQAHVTQILIEKDKAEGVEIATSHNLRQKFYAQKDVILSAGAFGSPQILMLSGVGDKEYLKRFGIIAKKHLVGVGRNLQDHVFCIASSLSTVKTANESFKKINQLKAFSQYFLFKKGILTASPLEANAFLKTSPDQDRPNLQLHFTPMQAGNDFKTDIYNLKTYPYESGYSILPTLLHPKSVGYVGLYSANPFDMPLIQPNYLQAEQDRQVLIKGMKIALEIFENQAFAPYRKAIHHPQNAQSDEQLLEHIRKTLESVYHPVGTCKMGDDEAAVVDNQLRVRGIEKLRVADASIMPKIISGNTNAACIMIGEKAADLILGNNQ